MLDNRGRFIVALVSFPITPISQIPSYSLQLIKSENFIQIQIPNGKNSPLRFPATQMLLWGNEQGLRCSSPRRNDCRSIKRVLYICTNGEDICHRVGMGILCISNGMNGIIPFYPNQV